MFEKVKAHVGRHKTEYWIGSLVVVAGITYCITRSTGVRGAPGVDGLQGGPKNTASFIFRNKQTIKVTNVLTREGRGHPGWPVRNLESKRIFFSQKEAADTFDIPYTVLSGHLKGKFPDVDGLHFERVNLVPAP